MVNERISMVWIKLLLPFAAPFLWAQSAISCPQLASTAHFTTPNSVLTPNSSISHKEWVTVTMKDGKTVQAHVVWDFPKETLQSSEPTVILVHGISRTHAYFDPLATELTASGFRVMRLDLLNRGHTQHQYGVLKMVTIDDDAHVLTEVIRHLHYTGRRLNNVILIGHSRGAAVALMSLFTLQSDLFNQLPIAKFIALAPFVSWNALLNYQARLISPTWTHFFFWPQSLTQLALNWDIWQTTSAGMNLPTVTRNNLRGMVQSLSPHERVGSEEEELKRLIGILAGTQGAELKSFWARVGSPEFPFQTSIIYGGRDLDLAPPEIIKSTANPNIDYQLISDATHGLPLELSGITAILEHIRLAQHSSPRATRGRP